MHWDRQGDDSAGGERWFELAPITDLDDTAICYIGWYTHHAQRHSESASSERRAGRGDGALELIATTRVVRVEMDIQPGDAQLNNNGRIPHSPEAYEDS